MRDCQNQNLHKVQALRGQIYVYEIPQLVEMFLRFKFRIPVQDFDKCYACHSLSVASDLVQRLAWVEGCQTLSLFGRFSPQIS